MKKEDFIVGAWYQNSNWLTEKDYAKYEEFLDPSITFQECIERGIYSKRTGKWTTRGGDIRRVGISEISKYLPEGHPDKTISYEIY